jgi:PPK2 family polyphosphate:nucleotide phosphotransferase
MRGMSASEPITDLLRLEKGPVSLVAYDAGHTPGFDGGKSDGKAALEALDPALSELQEMLFAEGRAGGGRRVLLVLQGMDTSGKGGVMRHAVALLDPQGVHIKAFGKPTDEELAHDFLWRVERALPAAGLVGIFDRSHYEDVLVARVRELAPPEEIERRYDAINEFEARLVESGTTVVKCMLHISADEQRQRLLARLDDPTKHWKFDPADLEARGRWSSYQSAYETALERTNTDAAPWLIVPSDRKWYRNWAVGQILLETLESLDLSWPEAHFDVEEQRRRLAEEGFGG